jgi:2-Cys peroxiredoxin 5
VADAAALRAAGAAVVACMAVNDPFVMAAWGDAHGAQGKARAACSMTGHRRSAF